ncbi:ATP-binding cassette domain-containing protein [Bacillus sp. EB106-08-02-XG196]|uniref:ABC transporter ATP-binding protein n=1 Tax=Bacillus sp. EB106-08-02-XG196 TaxID=2737049 RepID=UPI0015C4C741|nr:ATP-binding cassette domain-containing protein [Bacillus sp. EB106-08-02-XG196]NWQ39532.1 ATP-binding cassette domain-containing protein [Bacillus sp. EB106-08-02-XG196]
MSPYEQIKAEGLGFSYEEGDIFTDLTFSIEKNQSLLLLGPSGSGKSTLAYCLNKLYPEAVDGVIKGSITFEGKNLDDFKPGELNQKIGIVFQDPESQFCMLTVEEEVAFGLENFHVPRAEMEAKIDHALEWVGLQAEKKTTIHTLSGGQKQKLAIACVLVLQPEVIILDEPTANLDPLSSSDLVETIARLKKERPFTLIVVEHKLDDWVELIDRCLVLDSSARILFDGTPEQCFGEFAPFLKKEGIWLPKVVEAAITAKNAGVYKGERLPLRNHELLSGLKNPDVFLKKEIKIMSKSEPILEVSGLSARGHLKNVSLTIHKGELTALVGANGSGKTTLSKCLAGLIPLSQGEIHFLGVPLSKWKEKDLFQLLGYVFQNPEHQFITDSVYEEIAFGLEHRKSALSILEKIGLEKHANAHPFSLSQGQKRRLSVATMLVHEQELLILDEPTFGQDANTAYEIMRVLDEKIGAVFMITHDMELVDQYADTVHVLDEGELIFSGTPESLWENHEVVDRARLKLPFRKQLQNEIVRREIHVAT